MVLLSLLAVGMLSLAVISLRKSDGSIALAEARANARMALVVALGQLQKEMGPDRRVSASSGILGTSSAPVTKPNITGVWDSWWDFNPATAPDYAGEKTNRFRRWMVSGADPGGRDFVTGEWNGRTIELVGNGSLGADATAAEKVTAGLVPVSRNGKTEGSYAWHVADESVKARINLYRDPERNDTLAQKRALVAGHRPDPSVIPGPDGNLLTYFPTDQTAAGFAEAATSVGRITDLDQAELLDQAIGMIKPLRNDITPYSLGVMADVRGGGLKEDLTSVFEMGATPGGRLPPEFERRRLYQSTHGITGISDPKWNALAAYYNSFRNLTDADTNPTIAVEADSSFTDPVPDGFNPAPVIAKVDTIFGLVGRPLTDVGWIDKSKFDYFVDMVFTPVVTLHNPYNFNISFHKMEVTFTNIPLGFNFVLQEGGPGAGGGGSKSVVPGTFETLNTMGQNPPNRGEKKFVVNIANWATNEPLKTNSDISGPIIMKPGQTLICGPILRPDSSFYRDARSGYNNDAYDWSKRNNLTEKIKAKPSFTPGLGFEITATTISNTRFGSGMGSWCSYLMLRDQRARPKVSQSTVTDRFHVEFKMQKPYWYTDNLASSSATLNKIEADPSFSVTAKLQASERGTLEDYAQLEFNYRDNSTLNSVFDDRVYRYPPTGSLTGSQVGAPGGVLYNEQGAYVHPIAIFSVYSRTTNGGVYETNRRSKSQSDSPQLNLLRDGRLAGKPFVFHNPSRSNFAMDLASEKPGVQAYELNFQPFLSQGDFQDYMDVDASNRVPCLTGNKTTTGIKSGSYLELPSGPLQTIADFRRSNALTTSYLPQFVQPVGNSLLHPLMSPDRVVERNPDVSAQSLLDHSVLANHALYDRFYFSTFATRDGSKPDIVFEEFMTGTAPLAAQAFEPYLPRGKSVEDAKEELFTGGSPRDTAYRFASEYQMVRGPFNVNSTSVRAWMAVLGSMNKADLHTLWARSAELESNRSEGIPITAMSLLNGGAIDDAGVDGARIDNERTNEWNGYRELTQDELETLAQRMVDEVRERGPFLSMSEFVNRQVGPLGPRTLRGAMEAAIAKAEINEEENAEPLDSFLNQVPIARDDVSDPKLYAYQTPEATAGNPAVGAPGWVTQGDLLRILEPSATVRGDTFVIRVYGESQDSSGKVLARAHAEAVVQRVPDYVDSVDRPSVNVYTESTAAAANKMFGRRFNIVSFRWLSEREI
ncbi:hypothetical protein [Haloferula sp. A504]|uniref:hypothetical protein n=1 Tax=Haloferula sp. A504 TaxID=3373601 RepID=UPI0031C3FDBA|nr:hypothetical protein [Verrucomicrobiaceae bacterium E54]